MDISERTNFHFVVRTRENFDLVFGRDDSACLNEISVKLGDLLVESGGRRDDPDVDIQTCIVGNAFDWTFKLKDNESSVSSLGKEILCKLKLVKNLTTGEGTMG